jgi:hypothetical protein
MGADGGHNLVSARGEVVRKFDPTRARNSSRN